MSAYLCSSNHISALVTWGASHNAFNTDTDPAKVAERLAIENIHSVEHRYSDLTGMATDEFFGLDREAYIAACQVENHRPNNNNALKPVDVLSLLDGYEYQACKHPEWESSQAREFCRQIGRRAVSLLDGYDDAPWSL